MEHEVQLGVLGQLRFPELLPLVAIALRTDPEIAEVAALGPTEPDHLVPPMQVREHGPLVGAPQTDLGAGDRMPFEIADDAVDPDAGLQRQVQSRAHAREQLDLL